jgi:hypothetical protein
VFFINVWFLHVNTMDLPRKRWLQDLEEDMRFMQVGKWWEKMQSKEEWRRIMREAKAHPGLYCQGRKEYNGPGGIISSST